MKIGSLLEETKESLQKVIEGIKNKLLIEEFRDISLNLAKIGLEITKERDIEKRQEYSLEYDLMQKILGNMADYYQFRGIAGFDQVKERSKKPFCF